MPVQQTVKFFSFRFITDVLSVIMYRMSESLDNKSIERLIILDISKDFDKMWLKCLESL